MLRAPFVLLLALLSFQGLAAKLTATYSQGDTVDSHEVRLPALYVAEKKAPTPLLSAGPFKVKWTGQLAVPKRYRLYFSFAGDGSAELRINGETILTESGTLGTAKSERLRLNSGTHQIEVLYTAPEAGAARFQLHWQERSFPTEPIPATSFAMQDESTVETSSLVYQGREIFARHLCSKCHLSDDAFGPDAMPELAQIPPILGLTGDRLQSGWVADWIANPNRFRPDTNMPRLVPDTAEGRQEAADMAAYLAIFKTGAAKEVPAASPSSGGGLYHELACASCHGLPSDVNPSGDRISLAHLGSKFQPVALIDYLKNPSALSPHTRMPNFQLDDSEAADLASFLLKATPAEKVESELVGDSTRGGELAFGKHCGACHAGLPYDATSMPSFREIAQQSWTEASCYQAPDLHLNLPEDAGAALEALRSSHLDSLRQKSDAIFAHRSFEDLRCDACHSRDGDSSSLVAAQAESEHLATSSAAELVDQSIPPLTYLGDKLHSDYIARILSGDVEQRARPWLQSRMPAFGNHNPQLMAGGFAAQHGLSPSTPENAGEDAQTSELALLGEKLLGSQEGFACITCHANGAQKATAAFEVEGPNFALSHERLRKDYYHRWMHDPTRIDPTTKMPRYSDEKGKTTLPILDGVSQDQFEAIWQYLHQTPKP